MSVDNHADVLSDVMIGGGNSTGSFIIDIAHACVLIGSAILIIFGGVVPYVFQYREIIQRQNAAGFSLYVCLSLFVANILRVLFWFGKRFEVQLLLQSLVMLACMFAMVDVTVKTNRKHLLPPHRTASVWDGHLYSHFWAWHDLGSYVIVLLMFSCTASLVTALFIGWPLYVDAIGLVSLLVEANLGTAQLLRNYRRKSTLGMSIRMVVMWLVGDIAKTIYFIVRHTPLQFALCSTLQITVDIIIIAQVHVYKSRTLSLLSPRHYHTTPGAGSGIISPESPIHMTAAGTNRSLSSTSNSTTSMPLSRLLLFGSED